MSSPPFRNVLVTGGAGFIGSNLVAFLMQESTDRIVVVDKLTYAGNADLPAAFHGNARFVFKQMDIADELAVRDLFQETRPRSVIHLAAETHVDRSLDNPDPFIQSNIEGTYRLLEITREHLKTMDAAGRQSFRFLHVSTDEVYGSLDRDDLACNEAAAYQPRSPYSASKAAADHLVRSWYHSFGIPVLVTNCSNNYGPWQHHEKLIPMVIRNAIAGQPISIYGKGENVRDWLHVQDHVRALCTVVERGRVGETHHIGGDNEWRNIDLVKQICLILDEFAPVSENGNLPSTINSYSDLIQFVEDRPGHDFRYALDTSKIRQELGWAPQVDFLSGLRNTVEWYLGNCQLDRQTRESS